MQNSAGKVFALPALFVCLVFIALACCLTYNNTTKGESNRKIPGFFCNVVIRRDDLE